MIRLHRPEILIRSHVHDVDPLDSYELAALENAWPLGTTIVGLGHVPEEMRSCRHITHVVPRPLGSERLRALVSALCDGGDTVETSPIAKVYVDDRNAARSS